jgi:hypothetical protein
LEIKRNIVKRNVVQKRRLLEVQKNTRELQKKHQKENLKNVIHVRNKNLNLY